MSEIHEKKRDNQNSPDYNQSSDSQANYEDPPEDAEVQTEEAAAAAPAAQQHFAANPVVAKAPEQDALQAPAHPVSIKIKNTRLVTSFHRISGLLTLISLFQP